MAMAAAPRVGRLFSSVMTNPSYSPYPTSQSNNWANPAVRPVPPGSVKGAFLVYLLVALIAIVGVILLTTSDVWEQALQESAASADAQGINVNTLVNGVKLASIVVAVIFVGLYLLFAMKMRAGRNWARIVLTVLSALSIVSAARPAASSMSVNGRTYAASTSQLSGWIGAALAVVAIVLMFLPASSAYFAASKAARQRM